MSRFTASRITGACHTRARKLILAPIAALGLALTACDDVSIVVDQTTGEFRPSEYARDAAQGPIPVVVFGAVFGVDGEELAQAVLKQLPSADWAPHARFVVIDGYTGRPIGETGDQADASSHISDDGSERMYSYVLLFNPRPMKTTAASFCGRRKFALPGAFGTSIRLVAGLCRGDKIATAATGRVRYVNKRFDDILFHKAVVGMMQTLTRPNQPQINR